MAPQKMDDAARSDAPASAVRDVCTVMDISFYWVVPMRSAGIALPCLSSMIAAGSLASAAPGKPHHRKLCRESSSRNRRAVQHGRDCAAALTVR
jgi:hypothetical protein